MYLNDPIQQFNRWYLHRFKLGLQEPNACILSTSKDSVPNARVVLLKWVDDRGFVFFTNYNSAKAKELDENSRACLLFYFDKSGRQIKVSGTVTKCSDEDSDLYFRSRPFLSRLASIASKQSQRKPLFGLFFRMLKVLITQHNLKKRPAFWGGYTLRPTRMEFFQLRPGRANIRVLYEKVDGKMQKVYLYP